MNGQRITALVNKRERMRVCENGKFLFHTPCLFYADLFYVSVQKDAKILSTVSFSISGGRVASVSGTHLPQAGQTANGNGALSALDALNAFLGTVQSGAVVTAVTDLYLCYELQSTTATPMALVPAWCVSTDTADYYVNCYTGAVSSG